MMRNHEQPTSPMRRYLAAATLSVCAFNLCGGVITASKPDSICTDTEKQATSAASAMYDIDSGDIRIISGEIPEIHKDGYVSFIPDALEDPVVKLASRTGDVTSIAASISEPMQGNPLFSSFSTEGGSYDNDAYCGTEKEIVLDFDPKKASNPETGLFASKDSTRMLVVHEAIHGLNDTWWNKTKETKAFESPQDPKIYQLQNACDDINRWLLYKNTGKTPKTLLYPEDSSVADVCSTRTIAMDTEPLREMFRCTNEGSMLKDRRKLKGNADLGHPWDNTTELASSITNLLKFDPGYIYQCLASQDNMEAMLIMNYVRATLQLSFAYQPELEQLLRQDQNTNQAIDMLLSDR